jgi:murein DD-endopeptidase MepM/ murein hydrolase activator NlpD
MSYRPESHQLGGERALRARDGHGRHTDHYDHHHPHALNPARGRAPAPREAGQTAASADRLLTRSGQVRLGRVAFWTIVGTLAVLAGWTTLSATYLAFHDDALRRLVQHQAEVQSSYEDRIAEMRMRIDRAASHEKLDQDQIAAKLEQIVRRQTVLEGRANMLGTLADPNSSAGKSRKPEGAKPGASAGNDRGAWLEPRGLSALFARLMGRKPSLDPAAVLARLNESLDRVEARETASLAAMEENFEGKAQRLRSALNDVGVRVGKPEGVGGPFIPVQLANDVSFERHVARIHQARAHLERLTRTLATLPLRKPVEGELDESSGFGVRTDPFLGKPAMHTGIDFRGDTGDPVHATAAGTVTDAGWSGGYGRMVEIDHGNGFSTRYGHLSKIDVKVGQSIKIGQVIGEMGSTGRSTGPHLHYETRIDGDAVNPQKFLHAGEKLGLIASQ